MQRPAIIIRCALFEIYKIALESCAFIIVLRVEVLLRGVLARHLRLQVHLDLSSQIKLVRPFLWLRSIDGGDVLRSIGAILTSQPGSVLLL